MLTGIYVFDSTTLTFQTSETVVLTSFDQHTTVTASGNPLQVTVPRGIYKIETNAGINLGTLPNTPTSNMSFFECPNLKDSPPEAPGLANGMYNTKADLTAFFVHPDAKSAAFPMSTH